MASFGDILFTFRFKPPPVRNNFLLSANYSTLWCGVPKAGTSTWSLNFLKMSGDDMAWDEKTRRLEGVVKYSSIN